MAASIDDVLHDMVNRMAALAGTENYSACMDIADDIITVSYRFNDGTGMLLGEVLEGVFGQADYTLRGWTVDGNHQSKLKTRLKAGLDKILETYKESDKNGIFDALVEIRSVATEFMFDAYEFEKKSEADWE